MSKLVVVENLSLDGVMQAPGRPDEDTRSGFDRGGWAAQALAKDPEAAQASMAGQGQTAAMLFGRRTYEDVVGHWLSTPEPNPFTEILKKTPKYVASRTLTQPLPHPNSTLLKVMPWTRLPHSSRSSAKTSSSSVAVSWSEIWRQLASSMSTS